MKRMGNKELEKLNKELNARLGMENINATKSTENPERTGDGAADQRVKRASALRKVKKKVKKRFRVWKAVLAVMILLIVVVIGVFFVLRQLGKQSLLRHESLEDIQITAPDGAKVEDSGQTVTYQGKKYRRNEAVTSILCMGVDREALEREDDVIGDNGQADTLFVAALDTETGNMTLVNFSRDSMVDVDVYNIQGGYVETKQMQLCLAYAYGDGKEKSCENEIKSVSRLLYGMPIDAYAAIDLPAVSVLNDAIGGVEVDVLEDLSSQDPALVQGAHVLLRGNQAEIYVRSRDHENVDANNSRMTRQRQYLTNFIAKTLSQTRKNLSVPLTLYDAVTAYMVTDISAPEVTYLASLLLQGSFGSQNIVTIPGEVKMGEEYAEYYVKEEALYQIILDVFYKPV